MRIVIDMQGAQTESRFRGIGRYTLAFAQGVVRNRGKHEVILALSGFFPDTIEPIRAAFDGLLPQENIRVWHAPGPVRECEHGNDARRESAELIREAFIASLQPDVLHLCSLFEGFLDDAVTSIGRFDTATPVSITLYDLIPLLNPDQFLKPNPRYAAHYERKIESLGQATSFLAISASVRQEGMEYLGVDESRFVNVSTAISPEFRPVAINEEEALALRDKIGLTRPFVLYIGGADEHKNLPRLIQAWSTLPPALRQTYQLLFAGKMPEGCVAEFRRLSDVHKLRPDELCFTGYLRDDELVQLYNLCTLFVFPSWHEGFGLPPLEAMACGAAVIAANTSSLPEVIGLHEALFDPFNIDDIGSKITQALEDTHFRAMLREHGLRQAKQFSWDRSAQRALVVLEQITQDALKGKHNGNWRCIQEGQHSRYEKLIERIAMIEGLGSSETELLQLAHCIAKNEREIDAFLRAKVLPDHLRWRIEGPFDSSYSLALLNREMARALTGLGHEVALFSTEGPGDFAPNARFLTQNEDLAAMHRRSKDLSALDADVVSRNLYPPRVHDMPCRLNLLHAYGWEESGFPADWVEAFNNALQGMTLMSEQVRKIMIDNGVSVPLAVSGVGVDHWERIASDGEPGLPESRGFRFLHVSSCFPRKGADVLLAAYGRAFRAEDDVTLVIKTFPNPHNEIYRWLEQARASDAAFPHVVILDEDYADAKLKALYEYCQVLVAPSRGEGFGLPMAEAMLSGLAVITTGWGGQVDFCTSETAWLVDYRFEAARTHFGLFDSVWAEPDVAHLARLMRELYELPASARTERAAAGRRLLLERFRWSDVARRTVTVARHWARTPEQPKPRVGWVTTWGTRCGIAGYSAHLIRNLSRPVTILAAQAEGTAESDGPAVRRCWLADDRDGLGGLTQAIDAAALDTLVIQFNYGFFEFVAFGDFLMAQVQAGRVVVVMMHATTDPVSHPHKRLSLLAPAFARCHRILVHGPADLNRLKALGLVNNVALFPHGIIDWTPAPTEARVSDRDWLIASYGFFLPHKGLPQLVEAIALLRLRGMSIRLRMVNAEYPVPESRQTILEVQERIGAFNLGNFVSLNTDYLSDEDSLGLLSDADLIIFPHQSTAESSSAAVRYGIASGRPVAVTPLPIFTDVAPAVHRLPGVSAQAIADGIASLLDRSRDADPVLEEQAQAAASWRKAHRYSRVALRLDGMLGAFHRAARTIQETI